MAFPRGGEIEFIGGPIDGHLDTMEAPLEPFLGVKSVSASESRLLLAALVGLLRGSKQPVAIPFAIYELDCTGSRRCYRYLGTHAVTRQQFRTGCGLRTVVERLKETMRGRS